MRDEILHSTLDWQPEAQLKQAARYAATRLGTERELYELSRSNVLAAFRKLPSSNTAHPH